jgi:hypothetical protein
MTVSEGDIILEANRNHIESGLGQYIPLCGASLDPADVERVEYRTGDGEERDIWWQSHETFCFDCHSVSNRRAIEGNEGVFP